MARPTRDQLAALVSRLTPPSGIVDRLWTHLERERRGGTSIADGFPSATMGGSGTSGSGGDVVLTSVESAVEARVYGATRRDDHRHHTLAALACLQRADSAIAEARGHLDSLDKLDKPDKVEESAWCRHHRRSYPEGDDRGNVPVSIRRPSRELCERCAKFEDDEKELPPLNVLERWAQGKRHRDVDVIVGLGRGTGAEAFALKAWAFGGEAKR